MKNEIRMYIAEVLLGWVIDIAPDTVEGIGLVMIIGAYFKAKIDGKLK